MGRKDDKIHKIADFLSDHGWECLNIVPPIIYAICGILGNNWSILGIILFSSGIILNIVCILKLLKKSKSIISLENTIEKKDIEISEKSQKIQEQELTIEKIGEENYSLFMYMLSLIFKKLELNDKCRISIYKVVSDKFVIMGRYSSNPDLIKIYRKDYPISEGFIGNAYRSGYFFTDSLNEHRDGCKEKYYQQVMNLCNISKETLKNISMKSRTYYCKALMDPYSHIRKAILVIEGLDEKQFTKQSIDSKLHEEEERLKYFVEKLKYVLPEINTENARKEGF